MSIWKGGRGVKAPYQSTHVRVPTPIKHEVEALIQSYKDGCFQPRTDFLSIDEATELAKEILKNKKSARVSLQRLLTAIYKVDISL